MTEQEIRDYAEQLYPPQKGKQWVRALRNAKVEAFVNGALWNEMKWLKISSNLVLADSICVRCTKNAELVGEGLCSDCWSDMHGM